MKPSMRAIDPSRLGTPVTVLLRVVLVLLLASMPSSADVPYESYVYDYWGNPMPSPQAYIPACVVRGETLGVGAFVNPQDVFVSDSGIVYMLDSGNDRIVCIDQDLEVIRVISGFERDGFADSFRNPQGLFVTEEEHIYIADTGNARIIELDHNGGFKQAIGPPEDTAEGVLPVGFRFLPRKLAVNALGGIYVVVADVVDGLLEFDLSGRFQGFLGAPRVAPSLADILWNRFSTSEQRSRQRLFVPTEFSNIDIDERGFILGTERGPAKPNSIRRLSPSGIDVLVRKGFHPPQGDLLPIWEPQTSLVDIAAQDSGIYSVLDQQRGRIFTYDESGHLLYVFGGAGSQVGTFRSPVALDTLGDRILVLDSGTGCLTVFEPTIYSATILAAIRLYRSGHLDESADMWRNVLDLNSNYDLAYTGIAKSLSRQEDYVNAMAHFKLGNNRLDYSDSLGRYRREVVDRTFGVVMTIVVAVLLGYFLLRRPLSRIRLSLPVTHSSTAHHKSEVSDQGNALRMNLSRVLEALGYGLYLVFHPFDGFWDLKYEKKGNVWSATIILALVTMTYAIVRQYTGFVLNTRDLSKLNILLEFSNIVGPFLLWCVVNWSLTTLMDGKGTVGDIYVYSAYALVPLILLYIPATILSNLITIEEGVFYHLLLVVGLIWSGALLFVGTMVTHHYSGVKTLYTGIFTAVGMAAVVFIGLLFMTLTNRVSGFVSDLYAEFVFRL